MSDNTNKKNPYFGIRLAAGILLGLAGLTAVVVGILGLVGVMNFEQWISFTLLGMGIASFGLFAWFLYVSAGVGNQEAEGTVSAIKRQQRIMKVLVQIALYTFLTAIAITVLFPFYWMLISSVKSVSEYQLYVPTLWPQEFHFEKYAEAFTTVNLGQLFLNTVLVGVVSTILSLIVTVLSAYAFARMDFKGKGLMFSFMLATMMIPGELFTITNYLTVSNLKWVNSDLSFFALVVPFLVSVFYIYLLRQNFMQIPNELYLAAKVDGTSDLKYLWKVMIPLSAPTLISITILKMMGAWNSYIWPKLVADQTMQLVTVGLRGAFTSSSGETDIPKQMAAIVLVTLPLLLVFIFFRKYIMRGVSRSGIKG